MLCRAVCHVLVCRVWWSGGGGGVSPTCPQLPASSPHHHRPPPSEHQHPLNLTVRELPTVGITTNGQSPAPSYHPNHFVTSHSPARVRRAPKRGFLGRRGVLVSGYVESVHCLVESGVRILTRSERRSNGLQKLYNLVVLKHFRRREAEVLDDVGDAPLVFLLHERTKAHG